MTRLHLVETCPPKALLKEVTWIDGDEFVTDYLLEKSELIALKEGDVIISRGDEPKEIYLMVSGLSKMTYTPNTSSLEKLTEQGALPNADIITGVNFEDAYEDYVVAGNVIGELGILTKRPYDVNLVCVTAIQAYCISLYSMEEAMKLCSDPFQGLQARMWKAIAIRIATYLLLEVPAYQAWSQEKIRTHLERAFVPTLRTTKLFVVTDLMEDVILIEGLVMDANSRNIYRAPAHIPRTVRKLIFIKSSQMDVNFNVETKLMIIPVKEMNEYDVMESEMQGSDLVMSLSSKCLRHTIRSRAPMHMKHRYLHHRSKTSLSISLHKSGSRVYPSPSVVSEERKDVTSVNSHSVSLPPNWQRNQTEWNSSKNFDDVSGPN
ncbi:hypothetical protein C0J52_06780 [Blattella germanica]|nr:hypothetical protein C0J52_06780 [Blattella germanica]